jgi:alpha-glucosidase
LRAPASSWRPTSNPRLLLTHPRYAEVAAFGGFIKQADSDAPEIVAFWGGQASYLDFTHPQTREWWKRNVRQQLLEYGIVSTWNDNNEFELWDDEARCAGFGEPFRIAHARPLQTLLMTRASYEAQKEHRPDERPYLISRSGCPGIQRYAQTWSGDNQSNWETLKYNIPMGLGLSLSGAPNTGHDVGGFCGNAPSPELFVRWVQNGVFHPRFTIHSYHSDGSVNEPWMYPEVLPIIREWIEFRYRLIPYLYTLLFESAQTGHPIIRPMVYAFPADPKCHTESFDFMLGPNLLVASVVEDGARRRPVYLPAASEWCDWYTGEWHTGGQVVSADAPLERIPLFVRAGGLIPMGKVMRHVGAEPDDVRQVFVFPHPTAGSAVSSRLIEDDGLTLGYQRGEYSEVKLEVAATSDRISLQAVRRGNYRLPYQDRIEYILPPNETRQNLSPSAAKRGPTRKGAATRLRRSSDPSAEMVDGSAMPIIENEFMELRLSKRCPTHDQRAPPIVAAPEGHRPPRGHYRGVPGCRDGGGPHALDDAGRTRLLPL